MRRSAAGAQQGGDAAPIFSLSGAAGGGGGGGCGQMPMAGVAPGGAGGGPARMAHRAVASDVTMQQLVANNVYFSVCWWVATVVATFMKTGGARKDFDDIRPVMIAMYMIFEPIR